MPLQILDENNNSSRWPTGRVCPAPAYKQSDIAAQSSNCIQRQLWAQVVCGMLHSDKHWMQPNIAPYFIALTSQLIRASCTCLQNVISAGGSIPGISLTSFDTFHQQLECKYFRIDGYSVEFIEHSTLPLLTLLCSHGMNCLFLCSSTHGPRNLIREFHPQHDLTHKFQVINKG